MIGAQGENLAFLVSMPRSGSTLLSLMLGNHPLVCCPPEPWIQLLLAELHKEGGKHYCFDHFAAASATADFLETAAAEGGGRALVDELNSMLGGNEPSSRTDLDFGTIAYNRYLARVQKQIFVDKTPRYYHLLDYLHNAYPQARRVILKRNPLDVALSYRETWSIPIAELAGARVTPSSVDFAKGLFDVGAACKRSEEGSLVVAYEELVSSPEATLRKVCDFLDIEFVAAMLAYHENRELMATQASSVFGDRNVIAAKGTHLSSLGGWKRGLSRDEISQLLGLIGTEIFHDLGYSAVLAELKELDIPLPEENKSFAWRSTLLEHAKTCREGDWSALGRWSYALAGLTAENGAKNHALQLIQRFAVPASGDEDALSTINELAQRLRFCETDRAARLRKMLELAKEQQGLAQRLQTIEEMHAIQTATLTDVINRLTKCEEERNAYRDRNNRLTAILRRWPLRVVVRLLDIDIN